MANNNNLSLFVLSAAHGANHFYQLLLPVAVLQIASEYGLSHFMIGTLMFSFNISYALLQLPFGYLSGRLGRKKILVFGLVLTSLPFLLIGFTDGLWVLGFLLFLSGIGGGAYHPNGNPLVGVLFKENKGKAMGFHQAGGSIGSVVSPLIAGLAITLFDWRTTFIALSMLGPILAILLWFFLEEPEILSKPQQQKRKPTFYSQPIIFIIASTLYSLSLRGLDAFAIPFLVEERGTLYLQASILFSLQKIAGIISGPICGHLSDIFSRKIILSTLALIQVVSLYTLTIIPLEALFFPSIVFGFASIGLLAVVDTFLSDITPIDSLGTIFGLHYTITFMSAAAIPPIFGGLIDNYGYVYPFILLGAVTLAGLIPLLKVKDVKKIPLN